MGESIELSANQKAWLRLETFTAVMERARNLELARIGLNIPQASVLYCLKISKEPMTPMKLARMMHKQPHTVSALVHRMEAQGLVSTRKDMKRKNWLRVSLTKKGDEAVKRWANATEVTEVMSCLSKRESEALYTISQKLHKKSLEKLRQMQPDPYAEPLFW
ncbi:MAG TPA: MarR family transcriptional regulator [Dehalococcoidia bacterium]|jgi:DNA-binding MarR family transcriptional regulator|nr:MarR family transcriptional regulator [Dehalococcoidia bacterium]